MVFIVSNCTIFRARQAAFVASAINKQNPWSTAFEVSWKCFTFPKMLANIDLYVKDTSGSEASFQSRRRLHNKLSLFKS